MSSKLFLLSFVMFIVLNLSNGRPSDGKYQVSKSSNLVNNVEQNYDDGKYRPNKSDEGRYVHMVYPYVHTDDYRDLGKYRHIHVPYNGGYGPYSGLANPYRHDGSGYYDHSLYTTTTPKPTTTRTTTTTTTTTPRPILFKYDDEGKHKILRQEEEKNKKKYDYLYLTENGIYGEEQAHLHHNGGTHAKGYYEYTGDDGKLYRVNYESDHNGFIPMADFIPTPPPIPDAIHKALKYVAQKRLDNMEMPEFDHRGFEIVKRS